MLYESWIHPVTILPGIASAAVGAFIALRIAGMEVSLIAIIGTLPLIGIVKKNAIMMIDYAIAAAREEGMTPQEDIRRAARQRFRPIMMNTFRALMGVPPIAGSRGQACRASAAPQLATEF